MGNIIGSVGQIIAGAYFDGYQIYNATLWNPIDELGLVKNIYRRPNESNIVFRNRIVNTKECNSSKQGLINSICSALDLTKFTVNDKTIYYTNNQPLSYFEYNKLPQSIKSQYEYKPPQIIIDNYIVIELPIDQLDANETSKTIEGEFSYDYEKTRVYYQPDITKEVYITWTLWKNMDQSYSRIWQTDAVPNKVRFRYQYLIDNELLIIEETPYLYAINESDNTIEEVLG